MYRNGSEDESFKLIKSLGRGAFAETYRALVLDPELRAEYGFEEVALKIPHDKHSENVLRRELELGLHLQLKSLRAPNLVSYLGFNTFDGKLVMVMECEERSLRRVVGTMGRQAPLPLADAVRFAEGVAKGLAVIHRAHVLHRDIKPENILLRGQVPKVSDFGLGRVLESQDVAHSQAGTLYYMSPEILGSHGATFSTDVWSMGVTLYEMVAGRLPVGDPREIPPTELMWRICHTVPPSVREFRPEVPEGLEEVVHRALAKDPAGRCTADEMAKALGEARRGADPRLENELSELRGLMTALAKAVEAENRLKDLVARYPNDPRPWQFLGELHARCQRHADAATAFRKGINADPESGLLHYYLGLAQQNMGKKAEAAAAFKKATDLDLDPSLRRHAGHLLAALR